jgi:hypothetical protein
MRTQRRPEHVGDNNNNDNNDDNNNNNNICKMITSAFCWT